MLEARQVKIQSYGSGLRLVNRLFMKITALADPVFGRKFDKLNKMNKYRNEVMFPSPLPRDESIELDRAMKRLDLGLSSKRYEMMKMGLSQREIEKMKEDIKAEKEDMAELEFGIGQMFGEEVEMSELLEESKEGRGKGNPNPVRPDPIATGEKNSLNATGEMLDG